MKSLSLVLSASLLAATVSAQCFESDFGVPIPRGANTPGVGDDVLWGDKDPDTYDADMLRGDDGVRFRFHVDAPDVEGDDILERLDEFLAAGHAMTNLDTGEPLSTVRVS